MKPAFGSLNATLAKAIAANSPKYRRIVEPFGDGGTYAFHIGHKPPKEHSLNVVDEVLFAAFSFVKGMGPGDRARLKRMDWVASQEAFEQAIGITATEGPEAFYRFLYLKNFGMQMEPEKPPEFDILKVGKDVSYLLYSLPMMKAQLKRATVTNEDSMSQLTGGGSDTFYVLLPKSPEDAEAVQGKLSGIGGNFFCAYKVPDAMGVLDAAGKYSDMVVSPLSVASIMMATMAVVSNYESKLVPIEPDGTMGGMTGGGKD